MGTNFAVAPGEYLQEWIDGNGMSVGEFRSLELSEKEACLTECGILEATRATFEPH